jgi:hypothetical protein
VNLICKTVRGTESSKSVSVKCVENDIEVYAYERFRSYKRAAGGANKIFCKAYKLSVVTSSRIASQKFDAERPLPFFSEGSL